MTTYRDELIYALKETDNEIVAASESILRGPPKIALYAIQLGLEAVKTKQRRRRRQELRTAVQPQFKRGITRGSFAFTAPAKKRFFSLTQELFGEDGWMIGDLNLGDLTKEQLIAQAVSERRSAEGSIRNAQFYEALAEPLKPGQLARDYWKAGAARRVRDKLGKDPEKRV